MGAKNKRHIVIAITVFLFVLLLPIQTLAEDYYWNGGTGFWDDPANWSPNSLPGQGQTFPYDNATLTNLPGTNATAYFTGAAYPNNALLGTLQIYGTDGRTMTLSISDGFLYSESGYGCLIGSKGVVNQTGGHLMGHVGVLISSGGTYNISAGSLLANMNNIQVDGVVNQTGGIVGNGATDAVRVGQGGVYNLSGTGLVSPSNAYGLYVDHGGVFNQNGGTVNVGEVGVQGGIYNLVAGDVRGQVTINQSGTFNQSGGAISWSTTPPFSNGLSGGSVYVGYDRYGTKGDGTYNLSGGRLEATGILVGSTLNYSGGKMVLGQKINDSWVSGTLTNNGNVNLSGCGTRTIDGSIVNNGTFKVTGTNAVYTGSFANNGTYISHWAAQHFNDLVVGQNGYLVGSVSDKFFISGNFNNLSTMNTVWNTTLSYLGFEHNATSLHNLYLAGADYGAILAGYVNNFSWGAVNISGESLQLYDGNSIAGGALYVRDILGLQISNNLITNITGVDGLNIYYLANLPDNFYLHGLMYDLEGGGHLMPISTPEPATILLLGFGLIGLVGVRRKFRIR